MGSWIGLRIGLRFGIGLVARRFWVVLLIGMRWLLCSLVSGLMVLGMWFVEWSRFVWMVRGVWLKFMVGLSREE